MGGGVLIIDRSDDSVYFTVTRARPEHAISRSIHAGEKRTIVNARNRVADDFDRAGLGVDRGGDVGGIRDESAAVVHRVEIRADGWSRVGEGHRRMAAGKIHPRCRGCVVRACALVVLAVPHRDEAVRLVEVFRVRDRGLHRAEEVGRDNRLAGSVEVDGRDIFEETQHVLRVVGGDFVCGENAVVDAHAVDLHVRLGDALPILRRALAHREVCGRRIAAHAHVDGGRADYRRTVLVHAARIGCVRERVGPNGIGGHVVVRVGRVEGVVFVFHRRDDSVYGTVPRSHPTHASAVLVHAGKERAVVHERDGIADDLDRAGLGVESGGDVGGVLDEAAASAHVVEVRADGRIRVGEGHRRVPSSEIDPGCRRGVMDARPLVVVSVPHRNEAVRDVAILDRGVSCLGMGVFDVHVACALHGGRDGDLGRNRAGGGGVRELSCRMRGKCDRAHREERGTGNYGCHSASFHVKSSPLLPKVQQ